MILGAWFTSKGDIFKSVGIYLFADLCWIANAFQSDDWVGVGTITVGIMFGLVAFLNMHKGDFHKRISK